MKKIIRDTRISQNQDKYMFDILWGETGGTRSVRTVEEEELKDDDEEEKNRITGPAAYLVPGLML